MTEKANKAADMSELPPLPRIQLNTMDRVRSEMAKLYKEGKSKRRDVQECARLANILSMIGRLIEGSDLEKRIEQLERRTSK